MTIMDNLGSCTRHEHLTNLKYMYKEDKMCATIINTVEELEKWTMLPFSGTPNYEKNNSSKFHRYLFVSPSKKDSDSTFA